MRRSRPRWVCLGCLGTQLLSDLGGQADAFTLLPPGVIRSSGNRGLPGSSSSSSNIGRGGAFSSGSGGSGKPPSSGGSSDAFQWGGSPSCPDDEYLLRAAGVLAFRWEDVRLSWPAKWPQLALPWMRRSEKEESQKPAAIIVKDVVINGTQVIPKDVLTTASTRSGVLGSEFNQTRL